VQRGDPEQICQKPIIVMPIMLDGVLFMKGMP